MTSLTEAEEADEAAPKVKVADEVAVTGCNRSTI
jgi:hypothetical protein